jgi:hypothetical protein
MTEKGEGEGLTNQEILAHVWLLLELPENPGKESVAKTLLSRLRNDDSFLTAWTDIDSDLRMTGAFLLDEMECRAPDYWDTLATICSVVSSDERHNGCAKQFIHQNTLDFVLRGVDGVILNIINSYLTLIDNPGIVFKKHDGALSPVTIALRHLGVKTLEGPELLKKVRTFSSRHISGSPDSSSIRVPRYSGIDMGRYINDYCWEAGELDLNKLADVGYTFSFMTHSNLTYRLSEDASLVERLLSNKWISEDTIKTAISKMLREELIDVPGLVKVVEEPWQYLMVSDFVTQADFVKHGSRRARGLALEEGLGL